MHTVCVHNANVKKENEKKIQYCMKTIVILYTSEEYHEKKKHVKEKKL